MNEQPLNNYAFVGSFPTDKTNVLVEVQGTSYKPSLANFFTQAFTYIKGLLTTSDVTVNSLTTSTDILIGKAATGFGAMTLKSITTTVNLTETQFCIIPLGIPVSCFYMATSIRNDTAIGGTGIAFSIYNAGIVNDEEEGLQPISNTIPIAKNSKTDVFSPFFLTTTIGIQLDAGIGSTFKTSDIVTVVSYYYELTSLTDV
jgi:hypothetical protein